MVERSYPQNLAWIHAVVSEKPEFMDDGQMTDACAMTVALLTKSSRAKNHTRDQQNVVLIHRWSLYAGSIAWKI